MRAVRIHRFGDEGVLNVDDVETPTPDEDEVRVAVHVAAINPFDTYVRRGLVELAGGLPHVLGGDAAGVVDSVGDAVTAFEPGERVFTTGMGLDRPGTYAEYVSVPDHRLAHLPDSVSFADAAAAAETVTTSLQALDRGGLAAGDVCLVQGAAGGVGHVAIQVAKHMGALVVGSCSAETGDAVLGLGADGVVDYRSDDFVGEVLAATGERPVDVILETHADSNASSDVAALAEGGSVVVLGEEDAIVIDKPDAGMAKAKQLAFQFMSHMTARDGHAEKLELAASLLAAGHVSPRIAATFPLESIAEAHRQCVRPGGVGKTLLVVREEA